MRKLGALSNGALLEDLGSPSAIRDRLRCDRQSIEILSRVPDDVVLAILARNQQSRAPPSTTMPAALKLKPVAG